MRGQLHHSQASSAKISLYFPAQQGNAKQRRVRRDASPLKRVQNLLEVCRLSTGQLRASRFGAVDGGNVHACQIGAVSIPKTDARLIPTYRAISEGPTPACFS
jgi:hypothetical protein